MSASVSSPESESEGFERLLRLAQVGLSDRAEAWPALLGVAALRQTEPADYFHGLLELATSRSDLAFETRQIWLDLSRTGHPTDSAADRTDLASVLLAYAHRCPAYGWHPCRVLLAARSLFVGCDRERRRSGASSPSSSSCLARRALSALTASPTSRSTTTRRRVGR